MSTGVNPQVRSAYVRQLARVIAADGRMDADEVVKLYEVCALVALPDVERSELLQTLAYDMGSLSQEPVSSGLLENEELRMALARDTLTLDRSRRSDAARLILDAVNLTAAQTQVLSDWIEAENDILRKLGAGEEWRSSVDTREIAARAAAVGIPLTTLYFAGITGFSAVGITSGLAAIGSATGLVALGLNPMTAGIAGLVLGGITMKKIADYALSNSSATALRQRIKTTRDVHLKAATSLAGDIPRFESTATRDSVRAASVLAEMRIALQRMEALAT